jgi:ATP-dependent Lon protease
MESLETIQKIKQQMEEILKFNKHDSIARETLGIMVKKEKEYKEREEKKVRTQQKKHVKQFKKMLRKKNSTNDLKYFKENLTTEEQTSVLKELEHLNKLTITDKPYRLSLLQSDIPQTFKAIALKKITNLRYMEPGAGEYYKIKNWVDTFMQIPFGRYRNLPLTINDGIEKCHDFMEDAKSKLDSAVYGLNDAKMQIMQMLGQWIANPSAMGTAIAINGPMGTGKTSLVKEGISKILNREFAFVPLGGATDSSYLEGHSYTYEGSTWGKIVDILIHSKSMNPIIYFDELDKISETPKGEEIIGILTHLTDTTQNSQFHDKYFAEIDFDLSKCLFIFSYNDPMKVNPILLDRMYKIKTTGYQVKDKIVIAQQYLIPKIRYEVNFKEGDIIIPDSTLTYIIDNYTEKEDGVRNLKRCIEIIYKKLNLYRLVKPGTTLFEKENALVVEFPFTVTNDTVSTLIKKDESTLSKAAINMYL